MFWCEADRGKYFNGKPWKGVDIPHTYKFAHAKRYYTYSHNVHRTLYTPGWSFIQSLKLTTRHHRVYVRFASYVCKSNAHILTKTVYFAYDVVLLHTFLNQYISAYITWYFPWYLLIYPSTQTSLYHGRPPHTHKAFATTDIYCARSLKTNTSSCFMQSICALESISYINLVFSHYIFECAMAYMKCTLCACPLYLYTIHWKTRTDNFTSYMMLFLTETRHYFITPHTKYRFAYAKAYTI